MLLKLCNVIQVVLTQRFKSFLILINIRCFTGRMPRSHKPAGIVLLKEAENQHFRIAGATRCTDPREIWHASSLGHATFRLNRCMHGWVHGPKSWKFPLFDKDSLRRGESFDLFLQMLGLLCVKLPCTSILNLTWFSSQFTTLLLRNRASVIYLEFFRAPCRKNALVEKWLTPFSYGLDILYHHAKFGEIEQRAPAVGSKKWCLYVSFYRAVCEAANCQYCFYSEAENQHIRPAGATRTDLREIWHGRAARGSTWPREISLQSVHGVGTRPQNVKISTFWQRVDEKSKLFPARRCLAASSKSSLVQKWLGTKKFVRTEPIVIEEVHFHKYLRGCCACGTVLMHSYGDFSLRRQMGP